MKKYPKHDLLSVLVTLSAVTVAPAATVNVDIQGALAGGPGFNQNIGTYDGTAAAPSTGTTWNAFEFNNTLSPVLLDDQGATTDVQIWLQGNPGEWSYANANTLMGDYTFSSAVWGTNTGERFTIFSNLADGGTGMQLDGAKTYDIYVYTTGDVAGQYATFQLNHGGGTIALTSSGDGPFGGTFVEGQNYLKFSGVSPKAYADGFEFEFWWGRSDGSPTAALNGFQIVEAVPEPSTSLVALLGGIGLLGLVRRR